MPNQKRMSLDLAFQPDRKRLWLAVALWRFNRPTWRFLAGGRVSTLLVHRSNYILP